MNELRWILLGLGALLVVGIYVLGRRKSGRSTMDDANLVTGRLEPKVRAADSVESEADIAPALAASSPVAMPIEGPSSMPLEAAPGVRGRREPQLGSAVTAIGESEVARPRHPRFDEEVEAELRRPQRVEPTLDELPAGGITVAPRPLSAAAPPRQALPTRSIERRKIIALRLVAPADQRYPGRQLGEELARNGLAHGRYGIFHRAHDAERSVFSVASMLEPGSFDLEQMTTATYPGLTLFAVLPGPLQGAQALDLLIGCARSLQGALGGALQDDRGVTLSAQRIAALYNEIAAFEQQLSGRGPQQ